METNTVITLNTIICRNETKFIANALGDEMVMMDMENGDFISMNKVGADIWNLSQQPLSVNELVDRLLKMYNITQDQCISETMQFMESAIGQKIFTCHNANT